MRDFARETGATIVSSFYLSQLCFDHVLKLLICIFTIYFQNFFLQDALRKQQESEEFIEIGTNDILSRALGTQEYSDCVRARGHDVGIRELFSKPQGGVRSL